VFFQPAHDIFQQAFFEKDPTAAWAPRYNVFDGTIAGTHRRRMPTETLRNTHFFFRGRIRYQNLGEEPIISPGERQMVPSVSSGFIGAVTMNGFGSACVSKRCHWRSCIPSRAPMPLWPGTIDLIGEKNVGENRPQ